MPATLDATADPFADLIPEGSGNLGVTPEPLNPFADLLVSDTPATDVAIGTVAGNQLIGGGTADAPAIQEVAGKFSDVPRGVAVSTTDYGPFSDLAGDGLLPPIDVTERQFGPFDDLVPQVAPETEKAVVETPYPTSGFSPMDLIKQPQWMLNLSEGLAETIKGLIPQEPQDLANLLTPVATLPDQAKKTFGLVRDWMGGKSLTEAEATNFPESQILSDADKTAPFSKERFAAGFGMLAQMGMLAVGGRGLAKPGEAAAPIPEKPAAAPTSLETRLPVEVRSSGEGQVIPPSLNDISQPGIGGGEIKTETAVPQGAAVLPENLPRAREAIPAADESASGTVYDLAIRSGDKRTAFVSKVGDPDSTITVSAKTQAELEAKLRDKYGLMHTAKEGVYKPSKEVINAETNPSPARLADESASGTVIHSRFKLVGSRGRGTHTPQSDYDIATKLTPEETKAWENTPEGEFPILPQEIKDAANAGHDVFIETTEGHAWKVEPHPVFENGEVVVERVSQIEKNLLSGGTKAEPVVTNAETNPSQGGARVELAPVVEPQFTPNEAVKSILDQQPVPQPGMVEPMPATEGGALFSAGGKRAPKTAPVGSTPLGDKNWLRVPKWWQRAGKGLFTEGTRNTLGRVKNQVGKALGKATRQHVDIEQELYGKHESILREAIQTVPKERLDAAFTEASQFIRDKENGRTPSPLQPDAQKILDAWYDVGKKTGDIARANNVQVFDRKTGAYRPMGTVKDYIPRMFRPEVEKALRDPASDVPLFNKLADAIAKQRGITPAEAAEELRGVSGRFAANDHMANLELARSEQLPENFYEYDLRNLASRYLPSFSERMSQIIAYGQRLGPREAPLKQNLWDVARREAQDTDTQQWLNDAEDQATGFHPKSPINRNVRRAQALGNATLLSDPTTTVMRNMLSGLTVTTERFGIGRSLQQMVNAGRSASRMGAREIGVIRDDIGNFLGAEQLGDTKLDTFIREVQQKALKISGFTGSETFVRTHNAMTASAFARDAAAALSTKPKSGLSREALAMFKKLDVDPEKIVSEKGDWKTGPETRKFIRSTVRESQGGYRFDQVPIWAGSSAGRFLYQYGRWAIQRSGDIFRNTIKPAIGESVEFRGQRMTRRNVMPLIRLGLGVVGLGETFGGIASVLFGRDRKDASFSEIGEAFSEDESKAVGLLGERIANDIIMAGTLGLLSQPIDFIKSTKDQSRFKNPAEPPSLAGIKALGALAQKAYDQGGTLTKRDWLDAATAFARGPKNVTDVARHAGGERLYESQNDQRTLRNAARRWGKEHGLDMSQAGGFGDFRKSPKAPVFEAINDALLSGDAKKAQQVARDFIRSAPDKDKAKQAVLSSVEGKSPFRAGPFTADKYRDSFLKWSKKNLSADDQEQVLRVMRLYQKTARAAGLLD